MVKEENRQYKRILSCHNFVGPDPRSGLRAVRSGNAPYKFCKFIYFVCIRVHSFRVAYFFFFFQAAYLAISSPFIQSIPIRLAIVT